ncbi:LTA synthase family protein [Paenibacillus sp. y28]
MEVLNRRGWSAVLNWGGQISAWTLNLIMVGAVLLLLTAVIGRTKWAVWITFGLFSLLGLISGVKAKTLGVPLLPWDFVLSGETGAMVQYLNNIMTISLAISLAGFLVLMGWLVHKVHWMKLRWAWKERTLLGAAGLLLLAMIGLGKPVSLPDLFEINQITWDQSQNVETNGLALTFVLNTKLYAHEKPAQYDQSAVEALTKGEPANGPSGQSGVKPNIIVVLSESFWDPTQLPGVTFSRDPIPTFHELARNYSSGWMLSPQFGGGTANVEFEVLTGNSMRFLPQGSIPYNQYINRDVDSLAGILGRQGYVTAAINPYHSWFFNSKNVYKRFGFGKFISMEFMEQDYEGPYIADREVARNIIEQSESEPGPHFIFANTMENHFHYLPGKFKENTIKVEGGVSEDVRGQLETLAQGLTGADRMLKQLVDYYTESKEPTILVFFGDHLPSLGDDYKSYREAGYLLPDDSDTLNKLFRVPVVVWDNYRKAPRQDIGISPSFLGPLVLEKAELPGSYYTDFLAKLSKRVPVIPPAGSYAGMNIDPESLKDYETLQYDVLFGEQYAYGPLKDRITSPGFVLGKGKPRIDSVVGSTFPAAVTAAAGIGTDEGGGGIKAGAAGPSADKPLSGPEQSAGTEDGTGDGNSSEGTAVVRNEGAAGSPGNWYTVNGQFFPPQSKVYLDGKPQETRWTDSGELQFKAGDKAMKAGEMQVRIIDSKDQIVAISNTWKLAGGLKFASGDE